MQQHIESVLLAIAHNEATRVHLDNALGVSIRNWREQLGASLRSVAASAGLDHAFLHRVEHGRMRPSRESVEKILAALASMSSP